MKDARCEMTLSKRLRALAQDHRGFPVPWFVQWFDEKGQPAIYGRGTPDFRVIDTPKFTKAIKQRLCWVCGQPLGRHLAFLIGPMCAINRITSEPPAHRDCALFSARHCPFLSRPRMRRNEKELPEHVPAAGIHIEHNPGAICLWMTQSFKVFSVKASGRASPGRLIEIGNPEGVEWFAEGRLATRQEVEAAIAKGLPLLQAQAAKDRGGPEALAKMVEAFESRMPA